MQCGAVHGRCPSHLLQCTRSWLEGGWAVVRLCRVYMPLVWMGGKCGDETDTGDSWRWNVPASEAQRGSSRYGQAVLRTGRLVHTYM